MAEAHRCFVRRFWLLTAVLVIPWILFWQCLRDGQIGGYSLAKPCGLQNRRHEFAYLLHGRNMCGGNGSITLLIGVLSSAANFEQRAAIRETWGASALKMGFKLVFLLGSSVGVQNRILQEDSIHGDILQGQFLDAYHNLTCKSMMLIHWIHDYCSSTKFVLKIDDDMLLSVWDLHHIINKLAGAKRTMWGKLYQGSRPHRHKSSKWYVSKETYSPENYPDFLAGGSGYLITGDSIAPLLEASKTVAFHPLEDVYVTALLAQKAHITRLEIEGFYNYYVFYSKPCSLPRVITSHQWNPYMLREQWNRTLSSLDLHLCQPKDISS